MEPLFPIFALAQPSGCLTTALPATEASMTCWGRHPPTWNVNRHRTQKSSRLNSPRPSDIWGNLKSPSLKDVCSVHIGAQNGIVWHMLFYFWSSNSSWRGFCTNLHHVKGPSSTISMWVTLVKPMVLLQHSRLRQASMLSNITKDIVENIVWKENTWKNMEKNIWFGSLKRRRRYLSCSILWPCEGEAPAARNGLTIRVCRTNGKQTGLDRSRKP
jgi:hypothetical protein